MRAMPNARAVRITKPGDPGVLVLRDDLVVRDPAPGEVLVRVAAAGVNRADVLQRRGFYPAPPGVPSDVPGLEYAGTVEAIGEGVTDFREGDRVMGIVGGGAMATHLVIAEREVLPVPDSIDLVEAAALPEAFLTAFDALYRQAELAMGEVVVLHAVASGVGTAAIQLARASGAIAVGTSRSAEKLERCKALGLEHAVVPDGGKFAAAIKKLIGPAQVVFDPVGAAYLDENLEVLASRGRLVVYGLMGGAAGSISLAAVLQKRLRIFGTVLRSRPPEEKASLAIEAREKLVPLFAARRLVPVIDEVLPMDRVAEAHVRMEKNETFGKLVLRW
jgi:putative PIG3 family NAD(P)H quinone oxidoreductase